MRSVPGVIAVYPSAPLPAVIAGTLLAPLIPVSVPRLVSVATAEGVRTVTHKDGSTVPVAFVVTPTRVAGLPYFLAVWWTIDENDPRAATSV